MKTMAQMQSEMIAKAKFDGGYPRAVIMPIGIIALANNEDEFNKLKRESEIEHLILGVILLIGLLGLIGGLF